MGDDIDDSTFVAIVILILTGWGLATALIVFTFTMIHVCFSDSKNTTYLYRYFCHSDCPGSHGDNEKSSDGNPRPRCYYGTTIDNKNPYSSIKLPFIDEETL